MIPASIWAQEKQDSFIVTNAVKQFSYIGQIVATYEDKSGHENLNEVIAKKVFVNKNSSILNLGLSQSVFWLRFNLFNATGNYKYLLEIENPLIEEISLFYKNDSTKAYDSVVINKNNPFYQRPISNLNMAYILNQAPNTTKTYYLRIKSNTQMIVPLKAGNIITINEGDSDKNLLAAIYFGIMVVMFLYNLFVFFSVKDKSYLYYILYIVSVALVQLNITGFGFKYLWPNYPAFERFSLYLFPSITAFTSIAFITQFLNTKQFVPKLHKGFLLFIASYIFTLLNALWGNESLSYNLLNINALPLSLYMIGLALYIRIKHKYRPALFFLIAWTLFLISIIIFVTKDFGVLHYNLFTVSIIQIGSAAEVVLLSIALADRINIFKKEKEESQAEALNAAKENERLIREQNLILETKVTERTLELKSANNDLNKAINDLKEAETHLVEQEKMASLGQLTAGIAHEINNPINFVTSNVRPLKRDVEILLDMVNTFETISYSNASIAEKEEQVKSFKEDIDFDYLKEEIDHLLTGINEGASRTAEIVKGLRIFSRLDEDDIKRADINEGLDSTIVIINNLLNNRIKLVKNYASLPLVECYPGKLNQVFLNIITNAIYAINKKYNDQEGGELTISTKFNENWVTISIEDNGTGMDENTKKKLFEPFFTTKDVGEGTGLGLSIAYNTITKHNGRIVVNSELGKGTEFVIDIPFKH
jgi:signal transduction histidine kinase